MARRSRIDIERVDIRRAALLPGEELPHGDTPLLHVCPFHEDDSESLAIYPSHIHCMGCGKHFTLRMEALAWILKLTSWREAMRVAHNYYYLPESERQRLNKKPMRAPTLSDVGIYERFLYELDDSLQYLLNRGFSRDTIARARIGHNGAAFTIPVLDENYELLTIRFRRDDIYGTTEDEYDEDLELVRSKKVSKYRGWPGKNDPVLYPMWKFAADHHDFVVLVEGEFDALLLWQHGIPAITVTNGASQQHSVLGVLEQFFLRIRNDRYRRPALTKLIIAYDRDPAGIAAANELVREIGDKYEYEWLQWPEELGKDYTECVKNGYTFEILKDRYSTESPVVAA